MRRLKCNKDNTDVYENSRHLQSCLGLLLLFLLLLFSKLCNLFFGILSLKIGILPKKSEFSNHSSSMMDMATFTVRKTLECNPTKIGSRDVMQTEKPIF